MTDDHYALSPSGHLGIAHTHLGICAQCEFETELTELKAWRRKAEREQRITRLAANGNPDDEEPPRFVIGAYELSKVVGLKASTLMGWAKAGIIPSTHAPGNGKTRYLFDVQAVLAALESWRS